MTKVTKNKHLTETEPMFPNGPCKWWEVTPVNDSEFKAERKVNDFVPPESK